MPAGRFKRSFLIAHHISLHDLRKKRPSDLDGSGADRLTDIPNQNWRQSPCKRWQGQYSLQCVLASVIQQCSVIVVFVFFGVNVEDTECMGPFKSLDCTKEDLVFCKRLFSRNMQNGTHGFLCKNS